MDGAVIRHVGGSIAPETREVVQHEPSRADVVETVPEHVNQHHQLREANSYSEIYTRNEFAALIGRDHED